MEEKLEQQVTRGLQSQPIQQQQSAPKSFPFPTEILVYHQKD